MQVLGKKMTLSRGTNTKRGTWYTVEGRLRDNRFSLVMTYGETDPGEAETVRIAHGMRWVHR